MTLTREDKIWFSRLAFLLLHGINDIICGQYKTEIAIHRGKDILKFGKTDKSIFEE